MKTPTPKDIAQIANDGMMSFLVYQNSGVFEEPHSIEIEDEDTSHPVVVVTYKDKSFRITIQEES